jgi:hypothetical protein
VSPAKYELYFIFQKTAFFTVTAVTSDLTPSCTCLPYFGVYYRGMSLNGVHKTTKNQSKGSRSSVRNSGRNCPNTSFTDEPTCSVNADLEGSLLRPEGQRVGT